MADAGGTVDRRALGRIRDALTGSYRAVAADRELAAEIEAAWPGTGRLVSLADEWHRLMSLRAVEAGARSVIYAAAGRPPPGGLLHAGAADADPEARFGYVFSDAETEAYSRGRLEEAGDGRVLIARGRAEDPGEWLEAEPVAGLLAAGPASVHLVLAVQRWPPELCLEVLLALRRGLPPGSGACLSAGTAAGPRAAEYAEYVSARTGRVWSHSRAQLDGWLALAGFAPGAGGARDVRAWERPWAEARLPAVAGPATVIGAAGTVPG